MNAEPHPPVKSSRPLKRFVANYYPQFRNSKQQDIAEFTLCILEQCEILKSLTEMSVLVTYKCTVCSNAINQYDRRFILYEDLGGNSMTEIISGTEKSLPTLLVQCPKCKIKTNHEHHEKLIELPEVLIVNLQRFERSKTAV